MATGMTPPNGLGPLAWAAFFGRWKFNDNEVRYLAGEPWGVVESQPPAVGLAVSNRRVQDGVLEVRVALASIESGKHQGAGVVIGYASPNERYVYAQLAAGSSAYSIREFLPEHGWKPLAAAGAKSNLQPNRAYEIVVSVRGQKIRLDVDGVRIIEHIDSAPLPGYQIALIAAGEAECVLTDLAVNAERPRVFVAMQFGEPFDKIYSEVIRPESEKLNLQVVRIGELARPGIIFEDIRRQIAESKVVIAKITAPNQNVF